MVTLIKYNCTLKKLNYITEYLRFYLRVLHIVYIYFYCITYTGIFHTCKDILFTGIIAYKLITSLFFKHLFTNILH